MQCVICLYLHFNCESCHHFSLQNFDSRGQFSAQWPFNRNWQHPNKFEREKKRNTENPPQRANESASDANWRYTMSCNAHCVHVAIVSAINERQKRKNKIYNIVEKKNLLQLKTKRLEMWFHYLVIHSIRWSTTYSLVLYTAWWICTFFL